MFRHQFTQKEYAMQHKSLVAASLTLILIIIAGVGFVRAQAPQPDDVAAPQAAPGTAFTYQGRLTSGGAPVNGNCDAQFSLFDAASAGTQIGSTQTATISVTNGLFTVALDLGDGAFNGEARWLEIAVRCPAGSGSYTTLSPRQALTPAPYALALRPGALVQADYASSTGGIFNARNTNTAGVNFGVWGQSNGAQGTGVYGLHSAGAGTAPGVYGQTNSTASEAVGVLGVVVSTSPGSYSAAVRGINNGTSGAGIGVWGSQAGSGWGVYGQATGGGIGVHGQAFGSGGIGVYGTAPDSGGIGVYGRGTSSGSGYAGYFYGNVYVFGNFAATGTKSFKIDHPLDPANRYLYHFAQEAPEVQNVYNGVVTLDASGGAVVTLPEYFSALNTGPFRYQLTAIGAPMPNLHVAQEIQGNTFRIAGGAPGQKVSWEVTAIRNDPYLRDYPAVAEVDKPANEKGSYLYPQGYGQPETMGVDYQHRAALHEIESGGD
jgi:hypothetical protein